MTLSHNEHRLLSCGLDGSVFCQIMPSAPEDLEPSSPPPSASDAASGDLQEVDVVDETGELSITDAAARGVMGDEGPGDAGSAQGAELRQGLSRIRDSLAALKSANAGASAAEQLETNEFVVDTEMVELSAKATQETVNSLQADIRREILHTEALTHRIREPCWEGMESKGLSLFSFEEAGPVVHEFHTVIEPKAAHALRRVKFLRRVEQLECSWHQAQGSRRGLSQAQIAQAGRPDAMSQDAESAGEAGEAETQGTVGAGPGGARPETAGTSSKTGADDDKAAEGASGKEAVEAAAAVSAKEKAGREFQLLRVTKSLQMLIKDGEEASGTSEAVGMENRLEYNRQIFRKKKEEKQLTVDRHHQQIAQRKQQNQLFAAEVREMQATGEDQSKMHEAHLADSESQVPPGEPSPEGSLQKRMRSLVTLRKLIDISKAQAEEVVLLSQELDRLRLRTYPSFPQPMHGVRQRGPDEVNSFSR